MVVVLALSMLAALVAPTWASPAPHLITGRSCYGALDASCNFHLTNCINGAVFWSSPSCVAAATCAGVETLLNALCCSTGSCQNPANEPSLDYNLYAGIVGECAWASGGCPITQQNYIDFYFGTLTATGSTVWPDVNTVEGWWGAIVAWTATGSSSPYTNFNDWLHYSSTGTAVGSGGDGGGGSGGIIIIPPPVGGGGSTGGGSTGGGSTGGGSTGSGGSTGGGSTGGGNGDGSDPDESCEANYEDDENILSRRDDSNLLTNVTTVKTPPLSANLSLSELPDPQIANNYNIDCNKYPNICQNWCYYVYCKTSPNSWIVTVNRNAGSRTKSSCGGKNRCSATCAAQGFIVNPVAGLTCDEQPKNTNVEGGAGAATRCIPATENSSEGATWGNFIGSAKKGGIKVADGQSVTIVLVNAQGAGYCASYGGGGTTVCTPNPLDSTWSRQM